MKSVTATEASRAFAALLDEVERGERVVITRGGRRIAAIGPASAANGAALIDLVRSSGVDLEFAADVAVARDLGGEVAPPGIDPWEVE